MTTDDKPAPHFHDMGGELIVGVADPGACELCRDEARLPPTAPHPAPWHWENDDLIAANGRYIVGEASKGIAVDDDARALLVATPEMEMLLRHIAAEVLPGEYSDASVAANGIAEAAQAIVTRIDAAK
jgi:hypothetical protein